MHLDITWELGVLRMQGSHLLLPQVLSVQQASASHARRDECSKAVKGIANKLHMAPKPNLSFSICRFPIRFQFVVFLCYQMGILYALKSQTSILDWGTCSLSHTVSNISSDDLD